MTHVLLVLKLQDATDDQKAQFFNSLKEDGWGTVTSFPNIFQKEVDPDIREETIEQRARETIQQATTASMIQDVTILLHFGKSPGKSFCTTSHEKDHVVFG